MLAVGGKDAVVAGEVDARPGYQRSYSCNEVQGLEYDVGGAILVWCLKQLSRLGDQCTHHIQQRALFTPIIVGLGDSIEQDGDYMACSDQVLGTP